MIMTVKSQQTSIRMALIPLPSPWSGLRLQVSGFPVPEQELLPAGEFIRKAMALILQRDGGTPETFIQFTQLHLGGGAKRLASRGQEWLPRQGLGVWPDREPPHGWTLEELRDLLPSEKVRPLMDIVLRITSAGKQNDARDAMLGTGTVLQFLVPSSGEFLAAARNLLLPPITDPSYTTFAFYVPLLQGASVTNSPLKQTDLWMCGAHAFLRESPEDEGILLFARGSLDDILREAGAVRTAQEEWSVPCTDAAARSHPSY